MTRRRFVVGVATALAVTAASALLGGCASTDTRAADAAEDAVRPTTTTAATPTTVSPTTTTTTTRPGVPCVQGRNETFSFAPSGPPPPPGVMPPGSRMAAILSAKKIKVGVDDSSLFLSSRDENGKLVGLEPELARSIARAIFGDVPDINSMIDFIPVTTEEKFKVLGPEQPPTVDIMISVATMACDRWQQYNFSSPYFDAFQQLAVPTGSKIEGQADLGGKRVCVTSPSSSRNLLDRLNKATGAGIKIVPVPARSVCLIKVQNGDVDAIVLPSSIMAGLVFQDELGLHGFDTPMTEADGKPSTNSYGIVTNKNDVELTRFLNSLLDQWRNDGTLQRLQDDALRDTSLRTDVPTANYWPSS
jgi:polar amino acid transport system substrate-binding protein